MRVAPQSRQLLKKNASKEEWQENDVVKVKINNVKDCLIGQRPTMEAGN